MIKLEHIDVYGWETAIRGMRNAMNSWDKSDSLYCCVLDCTKCTCTQDQCNATNEGDYVIGKNDLALMKKLCRAGTDHRKFMRMITVDMDIIAPLYWWKEYDTYKVGTVANSCSTMHKIHAKEFTMDDFSHEHLLDETFTFNIVPSAIFDGIIKCLNENRKLFLETKDKRYWWQMIQLLPSSYNQKRTVKLNYEVLANMYHSRKAHKLDEWATFCKEIENLPYSELITGGK